MIVGLVPQLSVLPKLVGSVHTLGQPWPGMDVQGLKGLGDWDFSDVDLNDISQINSNVDAVYGSGPPLTTPATIPSANNSALMNSIASSLTNATATILKAQFGQPNLAPGEYVNTATGVAYRQPTGVAITGTTLSASLGSFLPLLLLAGGALLVYKVVASR